MVVVEVEVEVEVEVALMAGSVLCQVASKLLGL